MTVPMVWPNFQLPRATRGLNISPRSVARRIFEALNARRDPRQAHFAFYVHPDPPAGAPDPGKKQPSPASGDPAAKRRVAK